MNQATAALARDGGELRSDRKGPEAEVRTLGLFHAGGQGCADVPEDVHRTEQSETDRATERDHPLPAVL